VCKGNPDLPSSPEGLRLPVDEGQIEAAREILRDNRDAQWSLCFSIGLQVGDNVELRNNLIPFLIELDVPTATLSDMFGLSGRELWNIAAAEPVSVFECSDCGVLLNVRDRRDLRIACHLLLQGGRPRGRVPALRPLHRTPASTPERRAAPEKTCPAGEDRTATEDAVCGLSEAA
jgi:hypothetical protein